MAITVQMFDDDDDPPRNHAQEAIDDWSVFDFHDDLRQWFLFELLVQRCWEDVPHRRSILRRQGVRGVQHFRQLQATLARYLQGEAAAERWGDSAAIEGLRAAARRDLEPGDQHSSARAPGRG